MAGAALMLGLVFGVVWLLAVQAADAAPFAGTPGADRPEATIAELDATLAENPDDHVARLELAAEHFDASAYDEALEHYLTILDVQPQHARALARAGWIAFEGGDPALAARLVGQSLKVRPDDAEALWFLAHVRLFGLDDPSGAQAPLRSLLDRNDLSDGFRRQVERLLEEATG